MLINNQDDAYGVGGTRGRRRFDSRSLALAPQTVYGDLAPANAPEPETTSGGLVR